jgi:apolipoprotein N-acyltransferase
MRKLLVILKIVAEFLTRGRKKKVILVLFSAVLLPLAVPNDFLKYGNPIIGLFCMVPFYLAVREREKYGFSVFLGMLFGMISTLIMYYWLQFFGEYSVWTLGGVDLVYIIFGIILYPSLSALMAVFPRYKPFVFACGWLMYEFLKSIGFLAFPWNLLAHPFHEILPFIQFADITGVWGVSLLVALITGIIGEWIAFPPGFNSVRNSFSMKRIRPGNTDIKPGFGRDGLLFRQTLFVFVLVCAAFAYGGYRLLVQIPIETTFKAVLVQQNVDPWARDVYEKSTLAGIGLSEKGIAAFGVKPDIVIWNETSFQHAFPNAEISLQKFPEAKPFIPFVISTGAYFLVGAPYVVERNGELNAMNAAVLLSPEGKTIGYYGKILPVPFAEVNPFWEIKFMRPFFRAIGINWSGWTMGREYTVLSFPLEGGQQLRFSTPICFEDAFPDLCRRFILNGASVLINLTNVSWSETESAEIQMFVASKFRSIETRRTLVRSTNSGVTSVIGPFGETLAVLPLFREEYLSLEIPVYKEKNFTVYTVCGDWLPYFAGLVILFVLVYNLLVCGNVIRAPLKTILFIHK